MAKTRTLRRAAGVFFLTLVIFSLLLILALGFFSLLGRFVPAERDRDWPWVVGFLCLGIQLVALGYVMFFTGRSPWQYGRRASVVIFGPPLLLDLLGLGVLLATLVLPYLSRQSLARPHELVLAAAVALPFGWITGLPLLLDLVVWAEGSLKVKLSEFKGGLKDGRISHPQFTWPGINPAQRLQTLSEFFTRFGSRPARRPVAQDRFDNLLSASELLFEGEEVSRLIETADPRSLGEVGIIPQHGGQILELWVFDGGGKDRITQSIHLQSQVASVDEAILTEASERRFQTKIAEVGEQYEIEMTTFKVVASIAHMDTDGEIFRRVQFKIEIFKVK